MGCASTITIYVVLNVVQVSVSNIGVILENPEVSVMSVISKFGHCLFSIGDVWSFSIYEKYILELNNSVQMFYLLPEFNMIDIVRNMRIFSFLDF